LKVIKYKIFFILLSSTTVFSQNFLGLSTSNYAGTNTLHINPANVSDSRHKIFVNLSGVGLDIHNNAVRWKAPYSLLGFVTNTVGPNYKTPPDKIIWRSDYTKLISRKEFVNTYINLEAKGPAIQINFPKIGMGIAAGQRFRFLNSITNSSLAIGQTIVEGTKSPSLSGILVQNNKLIFNLGAYQEYYGTLGLKIKDDGINYIKIGATVKYLVSDLNTNLFGTRFDFQIRPDAMNSRKQIINLSTVEGSVSIANNNFNPSLGWLTNQLTSFNGIGKGVGVDFGFIYEYRPEFRDYNHRYKGETISDPRFNKYKYKFGFSLVDFGAVFYKDASLVKTSNINELLTTINPGDYNKINNPDKLLASLETTFPSLVGNYTNSYYVLMPANAIATFDYKIDNTNYYINTIWRQSLLSKTRRGPIGYSGITVIPRMEKKHIEFSVPIGLDNNYSSLNLGFMFRFSGFYIGSDNITGWLNLGNPRGASIYSGLFLPLGHTLQKNKELIWRPYNHKKLRNERY
jgi:hypothetical protein